VETLLELGQLPEQIAVFYRTNAQSRSLEDEFVRRRIAYRVVGGIRFYERKEVKTCWPTCGLPSTASNPGVHPAPRRSPARGIGPKTTTLIREAGAAGEDLVTVIRTLLDDKALREKKHVPDSSLPHLYSEDPRGHGSRGCRRDGAHRLGAGGTICR
jgi:superfamily I DNA/RNA helicase